MHSLASNIALYHRVSYFIARAACISPRSHDLASLSPSSRAATWDKRWSHSTWKKSDNTAAEFKLTAGKWYADEEADKGIQTSEDSKFYAISAPMTKQFDNTKKDLVLQVTTPSPSLPTPAPTQPYPSPSVLCQAPARPRLRRRLHQAHPRLIGFQDEGLWR